MPRAVIICCAMPSMRAPSKVTAPERGRSAPAMDFSSVDLPAPLAPATRTISRLATSRLTAEMATRPRYAVVTSCTDSMTIPKVGADDFRIANDVGRLALDQHLAEIEYDGSIDQRHHDLHDVLDHQYGDAGVTHPAHQFHPGLRFERRQACEHLIEQQQLRLGRERTRDFESPL